MLKVTWLIKRNGRYFPFGWEEEDPRIAKTIDEWIQYHESTGYDDIEECYTEIHGSNIVPDKILCMEGSLYAFKEDGIVKIRYPKRKL